MTPRTARRDADRASKKQPSRTDSTQASELVPVHLVAMKSWSGEGDKSYQVVPTGVSMVEELKQAWHSERTIHPVMERLNEL